MVALLSGGLRAGRRGRLSCSGRAGAPARRIWLRTCPPPTRRVVYIDVDAIRRSGILNMVAGSKAAEELEYQQFVDETKFDYRQDLDAVAAAFKDGQVFLALRGRFHWKNLTDYARHQGGSCHNDFCVAPGSQPNRRISFYPVKRGRDGDGDQPGRFRGLSGDPQVSAR